jgi:hypothetical protein
MREALKPVAGLDWLTALRPPTVRTLVDRGALDLGGFAPTDLLERTAASYPAERLSACYHAPLADERGRQREALLQATARELETIGQATTRAKRRVTGQAQLALRGGKVLNRFKRGTHVTLERSEAGFHSSRHLQSSAAEAALDGLSGLRTRVPAAALDTASTGRAYKSLATVERACRSLKTVALAVRPLGPRLTARVRAPVLLWMLAYDVEWHRRQALAPLLFDDDDKAPAAAQRAAVVAPAQRSPGARRKAQTQQTDDGRPVQSFQTFLPDLGTITKNQIRCVHSPLETTARLTTPTP